MLKTKDGKLIDVEELTWYKARDILKPLTPELVEIIDELSPSIEYKFYKAKYPFGANIIDKTKSYLPLQEGQAIAFNDPLLPETLTKNLSYDPTISNPVAIVLAKHSEFYLSVNGKIMPYSIVKPGDIFGLARILDNADINSLEFPHLSFFRWELNSGARSILMLPKITDKVNHHRLKTLYNLSQSKPNFYQDHYLVFKDIAWQENSSWRSEFLYFSNNWFEKLKEPKWSRFYCYLLRKNRLSYGFWRNLLSWQITFNTIEQKKNLRFSSYTLDTAKHLFAIAAGIFPGFNPAIDERTAPIKLLQEAYTNGYGLTDYWPIIMEPAHFSLIENMPVYYSLNYPTLAQSDPQAFKGKSLITLLDELQYVIEKYQESIENDSLAKATSLYNAAKIIDFYYYHNDPGKYQNIKDVSLIPKQDQRFTYNSGNFPKYGGFLKGCITLSPKK